MKIRGNKGDAEVTNFTSYFLTNKHIAKVIAQNPAKNPKIASNNLTCDSSFIVVVNFTTDN